VSQAAGEGASLALEIAEVGEEVRDLAQRVDEQDQLVRSVVAGVNSELDAVLRRIEAVEEKGAAPGTNDDSGQEEPEEEPEPRSWIEDATAEDWKALAAWVNWVVQVYELPPSRTILPCWPAHPGVAEELAALRSAWSEAALKAREGPSDALIYWHDRWFHPALRRIREDTSLRQCADRHKEPAAAQPTDGDLLTAVLTARRSDLGPVLVREE
jgi:hypothetical protein